MESSSTRTRCSGELRPPSGRREKKRERGVGWLAFQGLKAPGNARAPCRAKSAPRSIRETPPAAKWDRLPCVTPCVYFGYAHRLRSWPRAAADAPADASGGEARDFHNAASFRGFSSTQRAARFTERAAPSMRRRAASTQRRASSMSRGIPFARRAAASLRRGGLAMRRARLSAPQAGPPTFLDARSHGRQNPRSASVVDTRPFPELLDGSG